MENNEDNIVRKKTSNLKKILIATLSVLLVMILVSITTFYGVFFNEINAFLSFKKIDNSIYSITYRNDYFFDEFLETGAKDDAALKSFIMKKLLHGISIDFELPDYGCSSFSFVDENGNQSFARNLDIEYAPIMVVKTKPKKAYKSISMVNLSALGFDMDSEPKSVLDKLLCLAVPYIPFDGMNEKGVAICVNMVNGNSIEQNTEKIDITTTTLIRLVLDYADSTEKAIELISSYDLNDSTGGPYHFLISDKSGNSVAVEYFNNEIQVIENQRILTNHALNNLEPTESTFNKTFERYDTIYDTLDETNGIISDDKCFSLLKDVALSWGDGGALYSVVYDLENLEAKFVYKCNIEKVYKFKI